MNELVATIPAIIVICYVVGLACKAIPQISDNMIPVIVSVAGALLGVVGMYTIKDFPATDILNALAVGIASGMASTGANQVIKQLQKASFEEFDDEDYAEDDDDEPDDEEGDM